MKPVRIAVFMKDQAFGRAVARGLAGSGNNFILEVLEKAPRGDGEKTWEVLLTDSVQLQERSRGESYGENYGEGHGEGSGENYGEGGGEGRGTCQGESRGEGRMPSGLVLTCEEDCRISELCRAVWAEADRVRGQDFGYRGGAYQEDASARGQWKSGGETEGRKNGETAQIIGFSGCGGGSGTTAVAVTAGRMLAGAYGERILYLPLTGENGAHIYREKDEGKADARRGGKELLYRMLHGMPCSVAAYLHGDAYGVEQVEGVSALLLRERADLLEVLAEKGEFDRIIVDMGNCRAENDVQKNIRKMCGCFVEVASGLDCRYFAGGITEDHEKSDDFTERKITVLNHGRENRVADGREPMVEIAHDEESFFFDAEDGRVEISMSKNFAIGVKNLTEILLN